MPVLDSAPDHQPDKAPPARIYTGWVLLAAMFAFTVGPRVAHYVQQNASRLSAPGARALHREAMMHLIVQTLPRKGAMFLSGVLLLVLLDLHLRRKEAMEGKPPVPEPWYGDRLAWRAGLARTVFFFAGVLGLALLPVLPYGWIVLIGGLVVVVGTLLAFLPRLRNGPFGWNDLGIRKDNWAEYFWLGVLGCFIEEMASPFLSELLGPWFTYSHHPYTLLMKYYPTWASAAVVAFVSMIQAPIVEELVYRGSLVPALQSLLKSPLLAAVIGALLFAMSHPTGIAVWPDLVAFALLSSYMAYRTGSLVPSIIMHCLTNAVWVADLCRTYLR